MKRKQAHMEKEGTPKQHVCADCSASFDSSKRLMEHRKRKHGPVAALSCPHCQAVFTNAASIPRHVRSCPKRPEATIQCVIPASSVPASTTAPHSKVHQKIDAKRKKGIIIMPISILVSSYSCFTHHAYASPPPHTHTHQGPIKKKGLCSC